jgi:peptidoglycan/LPS O-acetylase OafA/YrhL
VTPASARPTAASELRREPGKARIPGLDGLRAIAVIGVMLYHAGVKWIPGGLLGVDVFFVISGFLITSLLLGERTRTGRIALRQFWGRRIRRLMPALVLVLLFVSITWGLLLKEDVLSLRKDVLFALGYASNWWFALSGKGYFQSLAAPSPVLHTWSLAVEEQFYLIWPPVVAWLLARGRRVGVWAAAGAGIAAVSTLVQSLAGVWTDRLYYGSDTRAVPLLVGAAVGAWYANNSSTIALTVRTKNVLQGAGLAAAVALGWAFASVSGQSVMLYRGGFLLLALIVCALIVSVALVPEGILGRLLTLPGLGYIGAISYGLYLWHWPLFLLVNHARTGLTGAGLLWTRLALTLTVSAVSYEFFEQPIRQRKWSLPHPRLLIPTTVVALVGVLVAATPPQSSSAVLTTGRTVPPPVPAPQVTPTATPTQTVGTVRVLIAGDSLALTLADALQRTEQGYQVQIVNGGELGCGISQENRRLQGQFNAPPAACATWPARRTHAVAVDKPDLAALLVGRWEITDQFHNGTWEHIGEPDFDAYLASELDQAIQVLSSGGAPVALITAPCMQTMESPDGSPYPESDPARLARFNELLVQAQARHPSNTTVVDLDSMVCPGGKYTTTLDGVTIRASDGIHFPAAPVGPLAQLILPQLRQLAVDAVLSRPQASPPASH